MVLFVMFLSQRSFAEVPVFTFKQWKSNQLIEAQNRTVRLINRLTLLRTQKPINKPEVVELEAELHGATQNIDVIKALTLEDYFHVYLSEFTSNNKALDSIAQSLSEAEVAELLKLMLKERNSKSAPNPNATGASIGGLRSAARSVVPL